MIMDYRRLIAGVAVLGGLLLSGPAVGQDEAGADEVEEEATFGAKLPPIQDTPEIQLAEIKTVQDFRELAYPIEMYRGAEWLKLDVDYVAQVRGGLELLYGRDYAGAQAYFQDLDTRWPQYVKLAAVGEVLVWQGRMLENFDYRFDSEYAAANKRAQADLKAALARPGEEGFEHFIMAGMLGIESIHAMRKEKYLFALQIAFDAMDHAQQSKEAAPDFVDITLADGMYNYWRTVVTLSSKILPDFGDHRSEGIAQMELVQRTGVFLGPPAALSLMFTWLEEQDYRKAIGSGLDNEKAYPDNVINNLNLGRTYVYMRRFDSAMKRFDRVLKVAPDNQRVRYYRGLALLRSGKADEAIGEFMLYLSGPGLQEYQLANTHYQLARCYIRQREYRAAETEYKAAVKVNGHKASKSGLERLKTQKKEGKIKY